MWLVVTVWESPVWSLSSLIVVWDSAVTEGVHQGNTMSEGLIVLSRKKIPNKAQMAGR